MSGGDVPPADSTATQPRSSRAVAPTTPVAGVATMPAVLGITPNAGFSTVWLALVLPIVLLVLWWAMRRRRRQRSADAHGDRVIGWTQVRPPVSPVPAPVAPGQGGHFEVSGVIDARPATLPFFPSDFTLRHDAAGSAKARAHALSMQPDEPLEVGGSAYEVTAVALRAMPQVLPQPETPAPASNVTGPHPTARDSEPRAVSSLPSQPDDATVAAPGHEAGGLPAFDAHAQTEPDDAMPNHDDTAPSDQVDRPTEDGVVTPATAVDPALPSQAAAEFVPATAGANDPPAPIPTGEAWARAGHFWWRLAWRNAQVDASALEQAADAFKRALALEPTHAGLLARLLARCHRELATSMPGDARAARLDAALAVFDAHLDERKVDDATRLDWVATLLDRATVEGGDRPALLERASHLLDMRWDAETRETDAEAQRLYIRIMRARGGLVGGSERAALEEEALSALLRGMERANGPQRDEWLTEWIDAEHARMSRMNGAARIAYAQAVQARAAEPLAAARSIAPLMAWLNLLSDWAGSLRGAAALRKLGEAEPLFDAIRTMAPQTHAGVDFARAYYLRLRAANEVESARIATLREALRLLSGIDSGSLVGLPVALEAAQTHLALADVIRGRDALGEYVRAKELALGVVDDSAHARLALTCAITAELAAARIAPIDETTRDALAERSARLLTLAPDDAQALRLAAGVQALCGRPRDACELCAAAWDAGADGARLVEVWRRAIDDWALLARTDVERAAWLRHQQRFRAASTFLP